MTDQQPPPWAQRLTDAHKALEQAAHHWEQAVRDARWNGATPTDMARTLGRQDRTRIYAALKNSTPPPATQPPLTPVAYVRGKNVPKTNWLEVHCALRARGIATRADHSTAWHLARGGVPVVRVDLDEQQVVRVVAKHRTPDEPEYGYEDRYLKPVEMRQVPIIRVPVPGSKGKYVCDPEAVARIAADLLALPGEDAATEEQ